MQALGPHFTLEDLQKRCACSIPPKKYPGLSTYFKLIIPFALITLALSLSYSGSTHAQAGEPSVQVQHANDTQQPPIISGQRLSDWLLKNQANSDAINKEQSPYSLGTIWNSSAEIDSQATQKKILLQSLAKLPAPGDDSSFEKSRAALATLIEKMPVTGRVTLPSANARYLEIQPKLNPILGSKDRARVPFTPSSITVIRSDGLLCKVRYQANVEARQYFRACRPQSVKTNWAWIIEPDGAVKKVSTAAWNETKQDVPAPGSWIWAPPRGSGWSSKNAEQFSGQFAQFLATQVLSGQSDSLDNDVAQRRPGTLSAQEQYYYSRDLPISSNIWGETGLLQTPSARTAPAGTGSIGLGLWQPYGSVNLAFSPLDSFEFYLRYTNINNVPYGSQSLSGGQTYKDKSTGIKIRLLEEDTYIPEIAVGVRDILGTGLFSGEYFVASKRYSDFDFNLGMGWGQLGTRNNVTNPFTSVFGSSFSTRAAPVVGSGGTPNQQYFHGTAAVFGGVQYHTPWEPLVLKVEVDSNNYQQLPFTNTIPVKSIFNFGATYQTKNVDFTVASLGNYQAMFMISLHERLDLLNTPKLAEAKPIPADLKTVGSYTPTNPGLQIFMDPQSSGQKSTSVSTANQSNGSSTDKVGKSASTATTTPSALAANYGQTLRDFEEQTHWKVNDLRATKNVWTVDLSDASGVFVRSRINLGVAALHRDAPSQIETFHLKFYNWGMLVSEFSVNRKQWMLSHTQLLPPSQRHPAITVAATPSDDEHPFFGKGFSNLNASAYDNASDNNTVNNTGNIDNSDNNKNNSLDTSASSQNTSLAQANRKLDQIIGAYVPTAAEILEQEKIDQRSHLVDVVARKPYDTNLGVSYTQIVGSPSAPFLFGLGFKGEGMYKFRDNTWLTGTVNVRAIDNFGKYTYQPPPTGLQPVRTDIRQYMTQSIATMPNFQVTNTGKISDNQFVSAYAGYLELMFAGAGGEYLWRPTNSKVAVGVDINRVRQRQFNVWTSMQNYSVTTGHVTAYWDTGLEDILVKLSYGKYLAGDIGGTLDLSRVFQNGIRVGAYATRTNVNYSQFGEGSFDKGVYISVPFDAFFARHSDSVANLLFTPLIRDGGAMLMRKYRLYDMTRTRDDRALSVGPGDQ